MSIYVYRRAASTGARQLAEYLEGIRYRAINTPMASKVRPGDTVVCWGESLPEIRDVRVLNGAPIQSKFKDAIDLKEAGIPTIEVTQHKPVTQPVVTVDPAKTTFDKINELVGDFGDIDYTNGLPRTKPFKDGVATLAYEFTKLSELLAQPIPPPAPAVEWLPRKNNHVGGLDLLNPDGQADFWVKRESIVREIRVHSFNGKSIRAGVKAPREGVATDQVHAWIRSYDGGWTIKYDGVTSKQKHRDLAHQAVAALGLQFGAVDLAETSDGRLIVLEVNRAPGIENGSVDRYATAIKGWLEAEV